MNDKFKFVLGWILVLTPLWFVLILGGVTFLQEFGIKFSLILGGTFSLTALLIWIGFRLVVSVNMKKIPESWLAKGLD